jgi:hypothetical protein
MLPAGLTLQGLYCMPQRLDKNRFTVACYSWPLCITSNTPKLVQVDHYKISDEGLGYLPGRTELHAHASQTSFRSYTNSSCRLVRAPAKVDMKELIIRKGCINVRFSPPMKS